MFKSIGIMLVSLVTTVTAQAGYDVEFLHKEHSSGYIIVVTDDYGKKIFVEISDKDMISAVNSSEGVDAIVKRVIGHVKPHPY